MMAAQKLETPGRGEKGLPEREGAGPLLELAAFSGPLDLLCALIDRQKIDIYDIPIAEVSAQYLDYLAKMPEPDMDMASDFLVMAATLLQIKSRMLLPRQAEGGEEVIDPREELVLRLLEYRRCKMLAEELRRRQARFGACALRLPESASRLGIELKSIETGDQQLVPERFWLLAKQLNERNTQRFNDLSERLQHILRREKVSLAEKLRDIWTHLRRRGRLFFSELFPVAAGKTERVTGFLALLELLRGRRVDVCQAEAFAPMEIFLPDDAGPEAADELAFSEWLKSSELNQPEEAYQN